MVGWALEATVVLISYDIVECFCFLGARVCLCGCVCAYVFFATLVLLTVLSARVCSHSSGLRISCVLDPPVKLA